VSSGSLACGDFKFSLVILDDELPHSLGLRLVLTLKSLSAFRSHVRLEVTMDESCQPCEILVAEAEDSDGLEDWEPERFVLGAIRDCWQIGKFGSRPRLTRLDQHVVAEVVVLQSFRQSLRNLSQQLDPTAHGKRLTH
jgi:hypothetical protein